MKRNMTPKVHRQHKLSTQQLENTTGGVVPALLFIIGAYEAGKALGEFASGK